MPFNYVAETNKHLCKKTAAKWVYVCGAWGLQACKNSALPCHYSLLNRTLFHHIKTDLHPSVWSLTSRRNKRLGFRRSSAEGKRRGRWAWVCLKRLDSVFGSRQTQDWVYLKTCNLQKWKNLFSSSTKWPYWLESWEAVSSHHMTLIAAYLYVCACWCLRACWCVPRVVVFAWADIRRRYRAYGRELRQGG